MKGATTHGSENQVNTEAVPVSIPDVYVYNNPGTGAIHLVNGTKYTRSRRRRTPALTMCGALEVPDASDENLPPELIHLADKLTPADVRDNWGEIASLGGLDMCGSCRRAYGENGIPTKVDVVTYDVTDGSWSRI